MRTYKFQKPNADTFALYRQSFVFLPGISFFIPNIPEYAGLWTVAGTYCTMYESCGSTCIVFMRYLTIDRYVLAQSNLICRDAVVML